MTQSNQSPVVLNAAWSMPYITLGTDNNGTLNLSSLSSNTSLVISSGDVVQIEIFHLEGWSLTVNDSTDWKSVSTRYGYQLEYVGTKTITRAPGTVSSPGPTADIPISLDFPGSATAVTMEISLLSGVSGDPLSSNTARLSLSTIQPQNPFSAYAQAPALVILTENINIDFLNTFKCELVNHNSSNVSSVTLVMTLTATDSQGNTVDISQQLGSAVVQSQQDTWKVGSSAQTWSYTFDSVDQGTNIDVVISQLPLPCPSIATLTALFEITSGDTAPYLSEAIVQAFGPYSLSVSLEESDSDYIFYSLKETGAGAFEVNPLNENLDTPPLLPQILDANNNSVFPPIPAWFSWDKSTPVFSSSHQLNNGSNSLYLLMSINGGYQSMTNSTVTLDFSAQTLQAKTYQQEYSDSNGQAQFAELLPSGAIIMWGGNTIPLGWALCDGSTVTLANSTSYKTPDLREKFVMGSDTDNVTSSGEGDDHTHSVSDIAISGKTSKDGQHKHLMPSAWQDKHLSCGSHHGIDTAGEDINHTYTGDGDESKHSHSLTGSQTKSVDTGNQNPQAITHDSSGNSGYGSSSVPRPPWYALCYIVKL